LKILIRRAVFRAVRRIFLKNFCLYDRFRLDFLREILYHSQRCKG
jgi:hypothetical protein